MRMIRICMSFALISFVFVSSIQCAKKSEQNSKEQLTAIAERGRSATAVSPASGGENQLKKQVDEEGFFTSTRLKSILVFPMDKAKERMLEYNVSLSYQCNDFHKARAELIQIISQYGFLKSGNTDIRHTSRLFVNAAIQAKDIYRFLLDVDRVGTLISEKFFVNDLTEEMVKSQRRIRREEIRIERKQKALAGMSAQGKNWQGIEGAISQSEDSYDQAEDAKWKILDRVTWANVTISLEPYSAVHIPPYKKALFELLDLTLWIPYALIYLTPLILLGLLIRWKWGWLKSLFVKKEKTSE